MAQCGRPVHCLMSWLLEKAQGGQGLELRAHQYLVEEMKTWEGLELVKDPALVNVCFWFAPPRLHAGQAGESGLQ